MKLSSGFWQTYKEIPAEAEIPSHQLMLRSGLIMKSGPGMYYYLPIGLRSIQKFENIVREELNKASCFEVTMPVVTPGELWKESGRWDVMGPLMLKATDRANRELCISPTNEESVVDIFRKSIKSYKQLPVTLYQINTKFRDEIRPRFGVMRGREFTMKDAYSFHADWDCLNKTYEKMYQVYSSIFKRAGLKFIAVEADAGAMADGKARTHEFQVLARAGEDSVMHCKACGYAANNEKAVTQRGSYSGLVDTVLKKVSTPQKESIEDVSAFLGTTQAQCLKSVVYVSIKGMSEEVILTQLLGDDELNENKLKAYLGSEHLKPATERDLEAVGVPKGYIGPYGLPQGKLRVIFDSAIDLEKAYVTGALEKDFHYVGFVPKRDFEVTEVTSLRLSKEKDLCASCQGEIEEIRGIEVGHIFQLGDKYTKAMNVTVLGKEGRPQAPVMGCYGIGTTRTIAASIEQNFDEKGIVWPLALAPYHVHMMVIGKEPELFTIGNEFYESFNASGIETLLDDRDAGPGFKFKDADLLGLPLQVVIGEKEYKATGLIEIKTRKTGASLKVAKHEVLTTVQNLLRELGHGEH